MQPVKIGIIGAGATIAISERHVEAYLADPRAKLEAVYDTVRAHAVERARQWKADTSSVCDSVEGLLERVDAVSICTPNTTHRELVTQALEAGKHVLCEKPLAPNWQEAEKATLVSHAHPRLVAMVAFNYRDVPAVRFMKDRIDRGRMGQVYTCRIQMGGNRIADPVGVKLEWRMQKAVSGAGALLDFGCHIIDLVDHLLSESQGKIRRVEAFSGTFIPNRYRENDGTLGEVTNDDAAVFNLQTEGGTLVSGLVSRVGMPEFTIEIVGQGGMLVFTGNANEIEVWGKSFDGPYETGKRETLVVPPEFLGREEHKGLIEDLLTAITEGSPYERSLRQGLYVQGVLDCIESSLESGKTVRVAADGTPE